MAHARPVQPAGTPEFEVRWRESGAFKQRTFSDEVDAAELVVELKIEKRDGGTTAHLARLGKRFREVAEASMTASAHQPKPMTAAQYALVYRFHVYPVFGERRINSARWMGIENWLAGMQNKASERTGRPLAPASVDGAFVAVSKVFAYALKHRPIATNPCAVVDKPRLQHTEPVSLAPEHVEAIASEVDTMHPFGLVVRFAAQSGLRAESWPRCAYGT
jgi:hypothetical protein